MERITKGMLQRKVDLLAKLGIKVELDWHQPGDAKYVWAIERNGSRPFWSGRMNARECLLYLDGMARALEYVDLQRRIQDAREGN